MLSPYPGGPRPAVLRWRPGGRGGPEPHLSPDTAVTSDDSASDVNRPAVPSLECGGAGGGSAREIIEDTQVNVGVVEVLLGRKENILVVFVRFAVMTEEAVQGVQEWIVKWIVASEECSEEIEGIRGMEVSRSVEIL